MMRLIRAGLRRRSSGMSGEYYRWMDVSMFGASCRVLEHAGVGPFPVLPFCGDAYFRDLGEIGGGWY